MPYTIFTYRPDHLRLTMKRIYEESKCDSACKNTVHDGEGFDCSKWTRS